jgi:outer membrane receptor for ferrienterochelin and colicin
LRSYEAGIRLRLPAPAVEIQAALYHIDWADMIYTANSANNAFAYNTNVGDVDIDGAEVTMELMPAQHLTLTFNAVWTDARLTEDQRWPGAFGRGLAGDRIPTVPTLAGAASIAYESELPNNARFWSRLDITASGAFASQFNTSVTSYARTSPRKVLDAAVGFGRRDWDLNLVVRNLLDTRKPGQILVTSLGDRQLYGGTPRTVALDFKVLF